MPTLWTDTIEAHRSAIREATLDAAAALIAEHGLRSVTMSKIAEATGIGRATLYKYFPDVESILSVWHQREVTGHLAELTEAREQAADPRGRLEAVLATYARLARQTRGHHDADLADLLHRDENVARAKQQVRAILRELLEDAARIGDVRTDVSRDELAGYCLHALAGARSLTSNAAVDRLVAVTLAGLRPEE